MSHEVDGSLGSHNGLQLADQPVPVLANGRTEADGNRGTKAGRSQPHYRPARQVRDEQVPHR